MLNIKELRERKNLTQGKLAELIGVSIRTIQNWESGKKNITVDKLNKINEVFDENTNYSAYDLNAKNEDELKSRETLLNELQLKNEIISLYKQQNDFLKTQVVEILQKNYELASRTALVTHLSTRKNESTEKKESQTK